MAPFPSVDVYLNLHTRAFDKGLTEAKAALDAFEEQVRKSNRPLIVVSPRMAITTETRDLMEIRLRRALKDGEPVVLDASCEIHVIPPFVASEIAPPTGSYC